MQRHVPAKNTLTAADAKMVEERFKARLSAMSDSPHPDGPFEGLPLSGTPDGLLPTGRPHALADRRGVSVGGPDAGASDKASRRAKKQFRRDVVQLWARRFAYGIRTTANSCCDSRASCAAVRHPIRIISPLSNPARSDAE